MICAWAFYSIYLAALLVHMVTILNIIGVACHHLCSINSLTNLTRPVLIKFHPLILPYKAKPIKKAKQVLSKRVKRGVSKDGFWGQPATNHQGFGNFPIFGNAEDIADQLYRSLGKAHKAFLELGCSTASLAGENGSLLIAVCFDVVSFFLGGGWAKVELEF